MSNLYNINSPFGLLRGLFLLYISILVFSCINKSPKTDSIETSDSLKLNYAQGFSIRCFADYKEVIVYSPWVKGSVYARYFLVKNVKTKIPVNGIKVLIPLQTLVATSVTHFEFLSLLNETKSIVGVCSPELIYNEKIRLRTEKGEIADLGNAFNINVEKTLQLQPQAVMMSGYNQNDPYAVRVSQAGIPVLFNNEWMEKSLLARAEWIKFVSVFYDKEKVADSIFSSIENQYLSIKNKAKSIKNKPNIMAGSNFRGTWYMPGGSSFMGQLFADAGANYYFKNDTTTGSLPLNFEMVLKNFSNTDIWLNCSFLSINDLNIADSKHELFQPVKKHQVYNFNKRQLPSTANDFWESAVARPDLLLADVIAILHPDLMPNYQLVYADKLK